MIRAYVLLITFFFTELSYSFPENIGQGYTSCATCHHSPDGGSKANDYGHLALQALIPDKVKLISWMNSYRKHREENIVAGYDETMKPKLQFGFGGSLRGMLLGSYHIEPKKSGSFRAFPMLMEARMISLYGNFGFYGAFNLLLDRSLDNPERRIPKPFSRAHWFLYKFKDTFYARLGRMEIPFGIKSVDHTRKTKTVIGQGTKDQSYGVQLDYISEKISLHLMPFIGNYMKEKFDPKEKEEMGASLTTIFTVPMKANFGLSTLLKSNSQNKSVFNYALFLESSLPFNSYALAEFVHSLTFDKITLENFGSHVRFGKHFSEWIDLYLESGQQFDKDFLSMMSHFRFGMKSRIFLWLELEPFFEYQLTKIKNSDNFNTINFALQLHAYY